MKLISRCLAHGSLLALMACSHGSLLPSSAHQEKSQLQLKNVWVRATNVSPDVGYRKNVRMTPWLLQDRVIQGNGFDGIVAIERDTGRTLWRIPINGGVEGGVTVVDDYLFFGGNDGYFYSASVATGKILWSVPVRSETLAAPTLANGIVYFLTGNNVLHALDASDGRELWLYSRVDNQNFSVRGASVPVVKEGVLLLGFSDGYLVALNAKNGGVKWEVALNKNKRFRDIDSAPVIDGEFVYVTGYDSHLYCVRLDTGTLAWKAEPGGFGSVLVDGERLFYSSSKGEVLAINKKDGAVKWRYRLSEGIATTPVVYRDFIVIGESNGAMRLLKSEDGVEVASFSPGHGIFSPIRVDQDKNEFYFLSNSARLYKIKADGRRESEQTPWLF